MKATLVSAFFSLFFLVSAGGVGVQAQAQDEEVILPGDASWLGDYGSGDAPDIHDHLPITYVVMGDLGVAIPRVIVDTNQDCPEMLVSTSATISEVPTVTVRAIGDFTLPHAFPIKVCQAVLETDEQKIAWNNEELRFNLTGTDAPSPNVQIPLDPAKFLLIGDTGLRVKPTDVGLGECSSGPQVYGVHQCPFNFSEADLNSTVDGEFQGLDDWPFRTVQSIAAQMDPDIVLHVGDYMYRQAPCPEAKCVKINGPPAFDNTNLNGSK